MNKSGGIGFLVFVLLIVLAVVVVFVVIFLKGRDDLIVPEGDNSSLNVSFFNVSLGSNAVGKVSYELRNGSGFLLLKGSLFSDALEFYRVGVPNGSLINLSASSSEYYWNSSVCNVSHEDFSCSVGLKRKALNYSVVFNGSSLVVDTFGVGVIQSPKICVTEKANVQNVLIDDLKNVPVPNDLKVSVDFCYQVEQDISGRRLFFVDVHKNPFFNVSDILVFTLRDFEVSQFSNIGDRGAGKIV